VTFVSDRVLEHLRRVSDEPDLAGTKYELVREIGRGGMGAVYLAEDSELGRQVALKVSTTVGSSALGARLRNEARVIAGLEHPGIVPVHDAGVLPDGRVFYAMKLVRGQRLDEWAKTADRRAALRLFQRICEAVAFAHAHGVVHRDLKPENVMVGEFGEALVMDWGLAKLIDSVEAASGDGVESHPGKTAAGAVLGTPAFMSPEQARGDAVDHRADVFALGAVLYFLLAGRPPYHGESALAAIEAARAGAPAPLRSIADVPRPLASICAKAMAREPDARYPSAQALAADIEACVDQRPVSAHRESAIEIAARFASRHRVVLSLLAVYLAVRVALAFASE
jgi:serine/threonine protein kinase